MAFNRPGGSRDDKSGRSSNRANKADDRPKRSSSTRGNSTSGSGQTDNKRAGKKFGGERSEDRRPSSSTGSKPYQSRSTGDDRPASSFTGGEKKSFTPKGRPYSGRPADAEDRPKRSFGEGSGDKKPFTPKSRPYSGRANDDIKPKRSFGGESAGDKKPFASRGKSGPGFFGSEDRPKRGASAGSFNSADRPKRGSSEGSFIPEDRPKRGAANERKFDGAGPKPRARTADTKFSDRPAAGGFKKREGDTSRDKPFPGARAQRSKVTYDKITPDLDAPAKTMRGRKKPAESKDSCLIRLNRYISNAGICSRRKADELIVAGVVAVNGVVINELGHKIDPQKDEIKYNGETLRREKMVYVLLNKPKDYITTTEDPQERRTVMHLVEKATRERIYPIGRLDRNTTGLLLMTNDGDLADKLSHPRNNIVKLYQVELNKSLTQGDLNKIGFGIELEDGLIKPDSISYVAGGSKREVGIQIHSGKNRVVRRIFESLGYEVVKLDRAVYANLTKKDLPRGRWRFLEEKEVIQLKHLIQS
jgi:23S rRNA pseudouridine2605 synthase